MLFASLTQEKDAARILQNRELYMEQNGIMVDDIAAEQTYILTLDSAEIAKESLQRRFRCAVVVGDSITESVGSYGWLSEGEVCAKIAVSVSSGAEQIESAIATNPALMFLCFGMNDSEAYGEHVDTFIDARTAALERIQSSLPETVIYVNAVFPGSDALMAKKSWYQYLDTYNTRLEELCESFSGTVFYINSNFILQEKSELFEPDGQHPVYGFYPLWLTYLADVVGLPA